MYRKYSIYIYFLIVLTGVSLYSSPYLKIHEIKTQEYPYIGAEVSVKNVAPLDTLNESNFSLFENGWKVGFFRIKKIDPEATPKQVTLLIDASKSLSPTSFKAQINAAQLLINGIYSHDQVAVIAFNDTVETHCGFTSSREQLKSCLGNIKQSGKKTVLNDALYKAIALNAQSRSSGSGSAAQGKTKMSKVPEITGRNFIVLFTDGKEEKSVFNVNDVENQLQKNPIPIFTVCAGKGSKMADLSRISRLSGGDIYNTPDTESIVNIYRMLGSIMDGTFQLQYISQAMSGKSTPVRLEIRMEHGQIHDQDFFEFQLNPPDFTTSLKNAFSDERFRIFLGTSILLILIVILITYFSPGRFGARAVLSRVSQNEYNPEVASIPGISEPEMKKKGKRTVTGKNGKIVEENPDSYFAYLIEKEGPHTGRTSKIKWNIATIGHGNENSIVIDDPTVSYSHARIILSDNEFYLYDMISESGVYLNGKKLLRPKMLNDFDEIGIGRTKLMFRRAAR